MKYEVEVLKIDESNINEIAKTLEGWTCGDNLYYNQKDVKNRFRVGDYVVRTGKTYVLYSKYEFEKTHNEVEPIIEPKNESGILICGTVKKRFRKECGDNVLVTYIISTQIGTIQVKQWNNKDLLDKESFVSLQVVPYVFEGRVEYRIRENIGESF